MDNLLTDGLIQCRDADGIKSMRSLPDVLAGLSTARIESFPRLARHQRHAWHAFLVQLAAIALHKAGRAEPPAEAKEWSELIRALTPEFTEDEPWRLVVDDLSKPAFMQPPVPEGTIDEWAQVATPDELDVLVTAKNHDLKRARVRRCDLNRWIFALVSLQTMEGYSGSKSYGISRMNGGLGTRVCVSIMRDKFPATRFLRDLMVLLSARDEILNAYTYFSERDGISLLWIKPWSGEMPMTIDTLDPYFIEICRRIRSSRSGSDLRFHSRSTSAPRVDAAELKGNLGDPWIPIERERNCAFTVGDAGFTFRRIRDLLFTADYKPSHCQQVENANDNENCDMFFHALARGQGKTDGLHERAIPIPRDIGNLLRLDDGRDKLGRLSERMINDVDLLTKKCLKPACLNLVQGAPENLNFKDDRADRFTSELSERVDEIFFPNLWSAVSITDDEAARAWQSRIVNLGWEVLREAERSLPIPSARRYRALAKAESVYSGSIRNNYPLLQNSDERKTA